MRLIVFRLISAAWIAVLVYGSLAPVDDVQGAYVLGDFVLHAFGYAALTVLVMFSQRHPRVWVAVGAAVALGLVLEYTHVTPLWLRHTICTYAHSHGHCDV